MKRFTYVILVIAFIAAVLAGCSSKAKSMTAVETVQKYFYYWNEKDEQGMLTLEYEKMPKGDRQLGYLNSVTLNSCTERQNLDKSHWTSPWYPDPYDFTVVDTDFSVDAENGSVLNGNYGYSFWLVKESKDADWMIVSFGMG